MTLENENALDHSAVGELWNANAEAWTTLTRLGYDKYRDHINTPAFMGMLIRPEFHRVWTPPRLDRDRTAGRKRRGLDHAHSTRL